MPKKKIKKISIVSYTRKVANSPKVKRCARIISDLEKKIKTVKAVKKREVNAARKKISKQKK